jgi:glycosyltransferase involved in cell wall biosynthesis
MTTSTASRRRGVLFVGHEATRTGAPIALLHIVRWFRENSGLACGVAFPFDGELVPAYRQVAETYVTDSSRWCPGGVRASTLRGVGLGEWAERKYQRDISGFIERCAPGVIYANSICAAPTVDLLNSRLPLIVHIHELEFTFKTAGIPRLPQFMARARAFIACSKAVKTNLIDNHGVEPGRVELVYESIPVSEIRTDRAREDVLAGLQIPRDAKVVVGGGSHNWRKGGDLFVQLAQTISSKRDGIYFVWIGGRFEDQAQMEHDARLAGVADRLRWSGSVPDAPNYLGAGDVFVLTSREDPYPLICLEAAALGKPIVCFADAGGMPEFVEDDCGFVTPYLDVAAMAARVELLVERSECRQKMGEAARTKVTSRHDVGKAVPQIFGIVERTLSNG